MNNIVAIDWDNSAKAKKKYSFVLNKVLELTENLKCNYITHLVDFRINALLKNIIFKDFRDFYSTSYNFEKVTHIIFVTGDIEYLKKENKDYMKAKKSNVKIRIINT